jgi:hypothetical protein
MSLFEANAGNGRKVVATRQHLDGLEFAEDEVPTAIRLN